VRFGILEGELGVVGGGKLGVEKWSQRGKKLVMGGMKAKLNGGKKNSKPKRTICEGLGGGDCLVGRVARAAREKNAKKRNFTLAE